MRWPEIARNSGRVWEGPRNGQSASMNLRNRGMVRERARVTVKDREGPSNSERERGGPKKSVRERVIVRESERDCVMAINS